METLLNYEDTSDQEQFESTIVEKVDNQRADDDIITIIPKQVLQQDQFKDDNSSKSKKEVMFTIPDVGDALTTADEQSSVSGSSASSFPLIYCEVCQEAEKRYKCPRCGILTCSVDCVKKHKYQVFF